MQRVIVDPAIRGDFLDALLPKVRAIPFGDPSAADSRLGTLISEQEAIRVETSLRNAVDSGAQLLTGGEREGAVISPAVVDGVDPSTSLAQDELFGPAVAVSEATDFSAALAQANDTQYGLAAGLFTGDVSRAVQAIRQIDAGMVHINWTPLWRADLMPYGGMKASGVGKEGFRTAVESMTEAKTVVLHGHPW